ncbi:MAG: insulinase family protein [Alloprevotella sp.]|nr:insulinase family protein [Alloprevotella sp.]
MHHQLPNGLRIICQQNSSDVVYCGYVIAAGTRDEEPQDTGMAHFLEHMSFKGTERRRAYHINNYLERVGGDLNAFTNKQETVYHATVLRRDFPRAAELLTDIVFHSLYPQREIDREVEVICDEIDSYQDSPSELIFDEFEAMLFEGHPLGRDILGRKERLRQYRTEDARRYADRYYRVSNATFFLYGNVDFQRVVRRLERLTADLPAAPVLRRDIPLPSYRPQMREVHRDTHQAHVIVGARAVGGCDERRFALSLLNNILGGPGMNSRLTASLRERAGLVYTVDSYLYVYPDTGVWETYFGCDKADVARCLRMVERELRRLADAPLSPAALSAAKQQLIGQMGIGADNNENFALTLGKTFAHYAVAYDPAETARRIQALTAQQLQAAAADFFRPDRLTTLVYK